MKLNTLGLVILCTASTHAAAEKEYWFGTDGEYVRDSNGHCVRTGRWTPEASIPGCEGGEAKTVTETKPAAEEKVEPAKQAAAADNTKSAPAESAAVATAAAAGAIAYRNLSLASGATFEPGGSTLSSEGKLAVTTLLAEFEGEEITHVIVEGYTDDRGASEYNQYLSEQRADAVKAELVANGVKTDAIETIGHGESNPIADNATRDGRSKNRRVEIKVDAKQRQL